MRTAKRAPILLLAALTASAAAMTPTGTVGRALGRPAARRRPAYDSRIEAERREVSAPAARRPALTGSSHRVVPFQFSVQGREVDAEDVGGAGLVVVDGGEGVEDVAAFDFVEGGAEAVGVEDGGV